MTDMSFFIELTRGLLDSVIFDGIIRMASLTYKRGRALVGVRLVVPQTSCLPP